MKNTYNIPKFIAKQCQECKKIRNTNKQFFTFVDYNNRLLDYEIDMESLYKLKSNDSHVCYYHALKLAENLKLNLLDNNHILHFILNSSNLLYTTRQRSDFHFKFKIETDGGSNLKLITTSKWLLQKPDIHYLRDWDVDMRTPAEIIFEFKDKSLFTETILVNG